MRIPPSAIVTILLSAAAPAFAQQPEPASSVLAAVPRMMWLSGVFRPTTIRPVAPVESVTVTIYRDREGGDALWRETQQVAMEPGGRYSLLMGSTDPDGLPVDLFTGGEPRWIGITVNRPGEVEQPRVPLASVPYALKAADADTLGGLPASSYLRVEPAPSASTQEAGGPAPKHAAEARSPSIAGTAGYLGKFIDSTNLDNSVLFQNVTTGYIGLGTTMPRDMFHSTLSNGSGAITGYAVQNLSGAGGAYSGMLFYDQNGALAQFQGFSNTTHEYRINNVAKNNLSQFNGSINFMIGHTSRFLVATNGNIGLGVPAPSSKLDVAGDINLTGLLKVEANPALRIEYLFHNTGIGVEALSINSTAGSDNTAVGHFALGNANNGSSNTGVGSSALVSTQGDHNTAVGHGALQSIIAGSNNIGIGYNAGATISGPNSNNISIGNAGQFADSGVIRIGSAGWQTSFFAAGVRGVTTGATDAVNVVIDSNGQLGTISSSRRFKEDIHDMGAASRDLMRLRPVTFRYTKPFGDGSKPIQYGLIAEEVAEVYPDLVARSADGQIETVKYQVLDAMLLNEVQRQQREIGDLHEQMRALQQRLIVLEAALTGRR